MEDLDKKEIKKALKLYEANKSLDDTPERTKAKKRSASTCSIMKFKISTRGRNPMESIQTLRSERMASLLIQSWWCDVIQSGDAM
jgi:hypothetical protein